MKQYTCVCCGSKQLIAGGPAGFLCNTCKLRNGISLVRTPQREAHFQVALAIRQGRLPKPRIFDCTDCSGVATEYDHRDYAKPLAVEPVCRGCNARRGPAIRTPAPRATDKAGA